MLELVATAAWWARLLILAAVLAVYAGYVAICAYQRMVPRVPRLCECEDGAGSAWKTLDDRWADLMESLDEVIDVGTDWARLSRLAARVGQLLGWFSGKRRLRVPFDEAYYEICRANCELCGCARGLGATVVVVNVGETPPVVVRRCATFAGRRPLQYIRKDALDTGGYVLQ